MRTTPAKFSAPRPVRTHMSRDRLATPVVESSGIRALLGTERHPIGATGNVMPGADGLLDWPFA
jgi:hypothetical protein